jgi:hypothetical protein
LAALSISASYLLYLMHFDLYLFLFGLLGFWQIDGQNALVKGINPFVHEEKETKGQIILGNKNSRYSLAFICFFLGVDQRFFCCDK